MNSPGISIIPRCYRLAIVPMSQEARGLDAGQRLVERLVGAGDKRTAGVVRQIALEEKAHVAVGEARRMKQCHGRLVQCNPNTNGPLLYSLRSSLSKVRVHSYHHTCKAYFWSQLAT